MKTLRDILDSILGNQHAIRVEISHLRKDVREIREQLEPGVVVKIIPGKVNQQP